MSELPGKGIVPAVQRAQRSPVRTGRRRSIGLIVTMTLAVACLCACGVERPPSARAFLPAADAVPGWTAAEGARVFDPENLYDLVDGQADAFFAYNFEEVAVRDYENAAGATIGVEVWRLTTPPDAYGLFSAYFSGTPVPLGNGGDSDPGRRLAFWQSEYYVRIRAREQVSDADLRAFADAVLAGLPRGGEPPTLLGRLPSDGLEGQQPPVFFRQEISIQDRVWLGGENVLGLGEDAYGVLAHYDTGGPGSYLLLVQYRDAQAASVGVQALQDAQVSDLAAADARDRLLGAVFGEADLATAEKLLARALGNP